MKFIHSFDAFLKNRVNLNQTRVDQANGAYDTLTSFLANALETKLHVVDTSKQGSLRQGTIIKPRTNETEFDVDLLVRMETVPDWEPTDYLNAIKSAFEHSDRYKGLVDTRGKHRCITIDYATNDFHVDVVPSIEGDGQCYVMNRDSNQFEVTDGDGYAKWFQGRAAIAGGMSLVRVVRLCKYLRDEHEWPVKSVLLTTLLGLQVRNEDTADVFPDIPTSVVRLLTRLDSWLQAQAGMPDVANPALPAETFTRHWEPQVFDDFRKNIHDLAAVVTAAYNEADSETSVGLWQDAFSEAFAILDEDLEGGDSLATTTLALSTYSHAQPVEAIPVAGVDLSFRVHVDAWVYSLKGTKLFRGINSGTPILSGRSMRFRARTNAPEPYDVRWQVVNTGPHAASKGALRGDFYTGKLPNKKPAPKMEHWERTEYTGVHWVECFILKGDVCVARSGRFLIPIKNPSF